MTSISETGPRAADSGPRKPRVFAFASSGGHWQQLMELRPAFAGCEVLFGTTMEGLPEQFDALPAVIVPDCNRNDMWRVPKVANLLGREIRRFQPDIVITTGALPGALALTLGKTVRARTIWVDSIANSEKMSMSGKMARRVADLWLSQWPHVAQAGGATYLGAVL